MTNAQLWWLTLEIVIIAVVAIVGNFLWLRHESRRLDREFGEHQAPGE